MGQTDEISVNLYKKWLRASKPLEEWRDALEDFLIVNNPRLVRELRKARQEHLSGNTRPWEEFKRELSNPRKRSH